MFTGGFFVNTVDYLLNVFTGSTKLVFCNVSVFLKFFEVIVAVTADITDCYFRFFRVFFHDFDKFFTSFFRQSRDRDADIVTPYDKTAIGDIEKAILKADLGVTPTSDGTIIRIAIPALTEERRVLSYGVTTSIRASGTLMEESWFKGVWAP
jgi:hypothetical protein